MSLPPRSRLFPYTTLFRSGRGERVDVALRFHDHEMCVDRPVDAHLMVRSEEHTSELQSREISYAVFCLKKKKIIVSSNAKFVIHQTSEIILGLMQNGSRLN